jgi:hypothetical protein
MKDLFMTADGDLAITKFGDISITDSVRQAVKIRLLWFFGEWRFSPQYGIPYYEEILLKSPNLERIKRIIRDEAKTVDGVLDIRNVRIDLDKQTRIANITFDVVTVEETYREELTVNA